MLAAVLALSIRALRALDIERSMQGDWMVVSAVMAPPDRSTLSWQSTERRCGLEEVRSVEVVPSQDGCAHLTVRNRGSRVTSATQRSGVP